MFDRSLSILFPIHHAVLMGGGAAGGGQERYRSSFISTGGENSMALRRSALGDDSDESVSFIIAIAGAFTM